MMTYQELKEEIAKLIFHQTTMEHDWNSRKDWVKDTFRKDTDEIFKLINEAGWEIVPKDPSHSEK
jgi:phosphoribosyl-ATP pyrophosphohydrolase